VGGGQNTNSKKAKKLGTSLSVYNKKFPIKLKFGLLTPRPPPLRERVGLKKSTLYTDPFLSI